MTNKRKLKVFITIDTEVWEFYSDIQKNVHSGLWGLIDNKEYGLKYQLKQFKEYGLKATFFLEPLFSYHSGKQPLFEAISCINDFHQEIGLHIHTEWLNDVETLGYQLTNIHPNIGDFNFQEQVSILNDGLKLLQEGGAKDVCSFRAGNYGADSNTLKALNHIGIKYDTSYNHSYLGAPCNIQKNNNTSPYFHENTIEFPITHFLDYPNHYRHLQLTACSFLEIRDALLSSWKNDQYCCVLVMHSFEWIKRVHKDNTHVLDPTCLKRFHNVCQFLANNADKFETNAFSELDSTEALKSRKPFTPRAKISSTLVRLYEQIKRRRM